MVLLTSRAKFELLKTSQVYKNWVSKAWKKGQQGTGTGGQSDRQVGNRVREQAGSQTGGVQQQTGNKITGQSFDNREHELAPARGIWVQFVQCAYTTNNQVYCAD